MMSAPTYRLFFLFLIAITITTKNTANGWTTGGVTYTTRHRGSQQHPKPRNDDVLRRKQLVLGASTDAPSPRQVANSKDHNILLGRTKSDSQFPNQVVEVMLFGAWCVSIALALISVEDFLATPSTRQQTAERVRLWGSSTVKGLAFGELERKQLALMGYADENPMVATLPSYNEIMLRHRTVHVARWSGKVDSNVKGAIRTVCSSLQRVEYLKQVADQYGWTEMRQELHQAPLADLSFAAADLGRTSTVLRETAGFDWGSCAWRHCGALADAQEAMDELDYMSGVLEPFEARFCLDIVERSLRDILAVVDWSQASPEDRQYYESLPAYKSIFPDENEEDADEGGSSSPRSIDDAYLRALQDLRVD